MKSFLRWSVVSLLLIAVLSFFGYLLIIYGVIRLNYPSRLLYPVHGIDVSHHQGEIDWGEVKAGGYDFVIMKATEGGDWKDTKFQKYFLEAKQGGLTVGAYHYYSFCKDPMLQANHFINVVGDLSGCLPPAIDLEFDKNCNGALPVEDFQKSLNVFLNRLEEYYQVKPIIYCNEEFYFKYLDIPDFVQCRFWIRNIISQPDLKGEMWDFWQYTGKGSVPGVKGMVDLNVFSGRTFQFNELILKKES